MSRDLAMRAVCVLLLLMMRTGTASAAGERMLTILAEGGKCEYQATDLLKHPQVERITIENAAAFRGQTRTFAAIPAAKIFTCVPLAPDARVEFIARDGYTANLGADQLLNTAPGKAVAYLAVEDPAQPWPVYAGGPETPGPFALIWKNPQLSGIGREQWPFKFNQVVVRGALASTYPQLVPPATASELERLQSGFGAFVRNCMACHKLNRVGPGVLGPDLGYPMSPTYYFHEDVLRQYIRNPQSVRAHPRSMMGPFPPEQIPDAELDNLILYLRSMSAQAPGATRAQIETLVRVSLASWESGDEQAFLATAHPDLKFAFPGTRTDAKGALEVFRYWRQHFVNTRVYVHWVLVDGQRFSVEYQFATTLRKDGKRSVGSTIAIGEVRDGKIAVLKEYTDGRVSRLQATGELPLDEGEEPYPWPGTKNQFPPPP